MPRYSGKHRNLTQEEQEQFLAEGRQPSIRFRVPEGKIIAFNDIVKGEISLNQTASATLSSSKRRNTDV